MVLQTISQGGSGSSMPWPGESEPPIPQDSTSKNLATASAAFSDALHAIYLELEYIASFYPSTAIPTSLLKTFNVAREKHAVLFGLLPEENA